MANELNRIPNPDQLPLSVVSGYQQQNENIFVLQTGLDTTMPFDNGNGVITIPAGGVVEVGGVLFKFVSDVTLVKEKTDLIYFIKITDTGDGFADASPVTEPGLWDYNKLGSYTNDNERILNWVSLGNSSTIKNEEKDLILSAPVNLTKIELGMGGYKVEIMGGTGGNGYGNTPGGAPVEKESVFILRENTTAYARSGAGGGGGGAGQSFNNGSKTGGGGGGGGSPSFVSTKEKILAESAGTAGTYGASGSGYYGTYGGAGGGVYTDNADIFSLTTIKASPGSSGTAYSFAGAQYVASYTIYGGLGGTAGVSIPGRDGYCRIYKLFSMNDKGGFYFDR